MTMRMHTPVTFRQQQIWLDDWRAAMEKMHYLDIKNVGISDSLKWILRLKGALRKPNLSLDLVKPDVITLWRKMAAKGQEAAHCVSNTDQGFECSFFTVHDSSYITGVITISRCPNP